MKEFKSYNVKITETPVTIEIWEYIDEPVVYSRALDKKDTITAKTDNETLEQESTDDILSANAFYDALKRKQKHYEEMRWEIARLVDCNFDNDTKFMTLTFKDNNGNVKETNNEFSKFIRRLNYHLYRTKKQKLKYLAVWEKQKRGAIHYHVIFFDFPYIKNNELRAIWEHGFVKINLIDVDSKENRGRYVSKYFSKDVEEKEYKQKAFFKSQNLKKPITNRVMIDEEFDFSNEDVVYTKTYSRKVPDFYNFKNSNTALENGVSFKTSTVRYTKIRKGLA